MRIARRFSVRGRVQGVGFRYFTQTAAVREQIDGWVRNTADGAVEILAEGEEDAIKRFEAEIRRGPASARVTDVWSVDEPMSGHSGFMIR
jgi:acylphosphatase